MTSKSGVENDSTGWRFCGSSGSSHRRSQGNGVMCHPKSQPHFSLYLAWKIPSPPFFFQLMLILVPGTAKTHSPSSLRYGSLKFFSFFFFLCWGTEMPEQGGNQETRPALPGLPGDSVQGILQYSCLANPMDGGSC